MTRFINFLERLDSWPDRHPTLDKFLNYLLAFYLGFACGVFLIGLTIYFYGDAP